MMTSSMSPSLRALRKADSFTYDFFVKQSIVQQPKVRIPMPMIIFVRCFLINFFTFVHIIKFIFLELTQIVIPKRSSNQKALMRQILYLILLQVRRRVESIRIDQLSRLNIALIQQIYTQQMEVSKLSSHLGSSDGDSENDLQQRMEDFQDLPEGPILINGKLKKTLQKISQRLQKIDNIKEKTKLDDEKVYEVLGKTLQTFFSIDATEYINETKQFMALSRFFFSEINRKIVVPEEEQQKQEQPRRQDIESRPAKNESKQNIIEHAFKQEEVIPKTVKKERVRQASRQNGNDPTMTTQINGERRQEQQWSQILNPTMFSNDEPSRIEARISNMSHPITWQRKAHFEVAGRKITKLHNDDYRKICADRPLTGFDNYRFKFRVEKLGTIAIGLVPERWKQGPFIDDRSITTFKFIGFANGNGGLIKYNLDQLMKGRQLAIKKGDIVELKVNLKEMKVHLKTHIQAESMEIDIRALKDYKLHLYVEMKQKDTCIEFIE